MTDRVEAAARASLAGDRTSREWLAQDRLLVAVGPDAQAEQLVRAGKRLADALRAKWTVVYVETPALLRLSEQERNRRIDLLRLAESLGAETVTLDGPTAAAALIEYAQTRRATRIIVGAPKRRGWRALWRRSTATELLLGGQGLRRRDGRDHGRRRRCRGAGRSRRPASMRSRFAGSATSPPRRSRRVCTAVAFGMFPYLELSNLVMVYLLGVVVAGLRIGRLPSVLTAVLNVLCFDFFFVPPRFTFAVSDVQYLLTFAVMLTVALVIATLMARVRQQTRVAGARERRTALLYAMSRELAATRDSDSMARLAVKHVAEVFQCECVVLLPDAVGAAALSRASRRWRARIAARISRSRSGSPITAAARVWARIRCRRRRRSICRSAKVAAASACSPSGRAIRGACCCPSSGTCSRRSRGRSAGALERAGLAETAAGARVAAERETLAQHVARVDLARPAHAARGDGRCRVDARGARRALDDATRTELARSIEAKARDMSELVSKVLDLMRFDSGEITLRRDWEAVDDLVGAALEQNERASRRAPRRACAAARICRSCSSTRRSSCRCSRTCSTTPPSTRRPAR